MDFVEIGRKWQRIWKDRQTYKVVEDKEKKSFYILDMFPYPSWAWLHVGHPKWYIATDVIARKHMLQWEKVLHPMGFDTFGLGTEQYAIANKMKPQVAAAQNIATYKRQLEMFGCTYDWDREVNTADPKYFKWTQKVFLDLYNSYFDEKEQKAKSISELRQKLKTPHINSFLEGEGTVDEKIERYLNSQRLAYVDYKPINRCPNCKTWLANEDLNSDWTCERCGMAVEQKPMKQRVIRITKYAERLLDWLDKLSEWNDSARDQQRNWIGKSEGTQFEMQVVLPYPDPLLKGEGDNKLSFEVYTTRIDTVFGMNFVVMAPEHKLVESLKWKVESGEIQIKNWDEIQEYIDKAKHKTQLERTELQKEKTWVIVDGIYAINPFNNEKVPLYIWDYVLANYGTGVVMAVPAHDERDFEFAKKYGIKIKNVVLPHPTSPWRRGEVKSEVVCYTEKWILVDSWEFSEMTSDQAIEAMQKWLEKNNIWWKKVNYRLQDWVFSRQRYRWEPIPMIHCDNCDVKLSINFYSKDIWDRLLSGDKTIESRALNPEEKDRYFGSIREWDIVKAILKETWETQNFRVKKIWEYDNLKDLFEDKFVCLGICGSYIDKYNTYEKFEKWYESLADWYVDKINKNWIVCWWFERIWAKIVPLEEKDLPLELPDVENYEPTGTEEGPLADIEDWINVKCPKCGWNAKRESNTMPGWAGSSRYWMRYMDPNNEKELVSSEKEKFWHPVDIYVWWAEHITRHMIYARFWHKFLQDLWIVSVDEPFKRYQHVWLIMAEDGRKMSKRRWNVINPDDIINEFGSDILRMYEMFMWPFDQAVAWNTNGVKGIKKFLDRVVSLKLKVESWKSDDKKVLNLLHKTIKKVTEDIDKFGFNTAISQMMILVNELSTKDIISQDTFEKLIVLLAPFAPHLAEELWEKITSLSISLLKGEGGSIFNQNVRPKYDEKYLIQDTITMAVQFNGKVRWTVDVALDADQDQVMELVKKDEKMQKYLVWNIVKIIYIAGKICNIVISE